MSIAVRLFVASVFLLAGCLKIEAYINAPLDEDDVLAAYGLSLAVIFVECGVGFWVASGVWQKQAWHAALFLFLLFLTTSISKIITGRVACGCFGRVSISPWLALFIDLVCICAVTGWNPSNSAAGVVRNGNWGKWTLCFVEFIALSTCFGLLPAYRFSGREQDRAAFANAFSVRLSR